MTEYIERGTAIAKLTALEVTAPNATMTDAKRLLADMPAADVAPVVHCRHCRSYNKPRLGWCSVHLDREGPDDFCGYGRKKDGSEEDVVETAPIVRCENCMYWVSGKNECESWEWCKMLNTDRPPNGFCYLGERKDEAQNEL